MSVSISVVFAAQLTVEPGLPVFEEHLRFFKERTDYSVHQTVYTFHNEFSLKRAKDIYEGFGYKVHVSEC